MTRGKFNLSTGSEVNKQGRDGRGVKQNATTVYGHVITQHNGGVSQRGCGISSVV